MFSEDAVITEAPYVQYICDGKPAFGDVQYFFRADINGETRTLALISCFGEPDQHLVEESYGALGVFTYRGEDAFKVIDVKQIQAVVAMVPFHELGDVDETLKDGVLKKGSQYFLVEKLGLAMAHMGGYEDSTDDN